MRSFPESDLYRKTDLQLEEIKHHVREELAECEKVRRKDSAALAHIRRVQAQRRAMMFKP